MRATVQHYQDGGVAGNRQPIPYTGIDSVIVWSEGQIGHPWDGVLVNVYEDDEGSMHENSIETYQLEIRDGGYEVV